VSSLRSFKTDEASSTVSSVGSNVAATPSKLDAGDEDVQLHVRMELSPSLDASSAQRFDEERQHEAAQSCRRLPGPIAKAQPARM
jgi:hypothetical protein